MNRMSSLRKRRREDLLVTQHVFLLPKGSEEQVPARPPVPLQSPLSIANPLAHPIVHETDQALLGSVGLSLPEPVPLQALPEPPPVALMPGTDLGIPISNTVTVAQPTGTNHLGIPNHLLHHNAVVDVTNSPTACATTDKSFQHVQPHPSFLPLISAKILLSPMEASSKKRSPFWQAFHQFNTKHPQNGERHHHAACNLCGKTVNMGRDNSTTTLSQHIRKCDRELWCKLKDTVVVPSSSKTTETKEKAAPSREEETNVTGKSSSAPSLEALKHYVQVAFAVRFKDPPVEEWAGLCSILHKELARRLSKESIRGIFQRLAATRSCISKKQQQKPFFPTLATPQSTAGGFLPTSIPIVNGSANSSLSSQECQSPLLTLDHSGADVSALGVTTTPTGGLYPMIPRQHGL